MPCDHPQVTISETTHAQYSYHPQMTNRHAGRTLVRYVLLFRLSEGNTSEAVGDALAEVFTLVVPVCRFAAL